MWSCNSALQCAYWFQHYTRPVQGDFQTKAIEKKHTLNWLLVRPLRSPPRSSFSTGVGYTVKPLSFRACVDWKCKFEVPAEELWRKEKMKTKLLTAQQTIYKICNEISGVLQNNQCSIKKQFTRRVILTCEHEHLFAASFQVDFLLGGQVFRQATAVLQTRRSQRAWLHAWKDSTGKCKRKRWKICEKEKSFSAQKEEKGTFQLDLLR